MQAFQINNFVEMHLLKTAEFRQTKTTFVDKNILQNFASLKAIYHWLVLP